jgi:hypothetical protein
MLAEALAIYHRHLGALILTCALALVPANVVMAGAVIFGLAGMRAAGVAEAPTLPGQTQPKQEDQPENPPPALEDRTARLRVLGHQKNEHANAVNAESLEPILPVAYRLLISVVILLAGLTLAHAAVVPLVLGKATGPARAWAVVACRIHALVWTALIGVPLVALGALCFLLPGIALAAGFAFAIPVTLCEGVSGRAALERSWALCRGRWAPVLGMMALILALTVGAWALSLLAPPGPSRALISGAARLFAYPLPLVGLVLLYQRARRQEGAEVHL